MTKSLNYNFSNNMKKNVYLLITIFILIFSCSKKDRLQVDTLELIVEPNPVMVGVGKSIDLTCTGKSAKSDNVDINPVWTVSPGIGYISPTRGKKVTFTAGGIIGTGKIKVSEGSVCHAEIDVLVGVRIIYGDNRMDEKLTRDSDGNVIFYYFDTDDSSPWQISTNDFSPGCDVDEQNCIKVDYTDSSGGWGGFYLEFTEPQDLSSYTKLTFWVKGQNGGEKFKVGIKDSNNVESKKVITATPSWQKIEISLTEFSGVNKQSIKLPFILAFEHSLQPGNKTIYIDLIQYEE